MESPPKLKLKLVIDKSKQRVVFAEAGQDFVDFLFHVHALPIATLAHIQAGMADSMGGSLGNLYKSIEDLEDVCFRKVANYPSVKCTRCDAIMDRRVDFIEVPAGETGYVKELVNYVVMDDFVVKPMSTDLCMAMLKDRDATIAVDKFADFGLVEGELLLEASSQSKTVLTDVFLGKKGRQSLACLEQCSIN
ncbi:hypothetical protein BT93_J0032 [Corymbia citriodora subsp. variegata]|nr:hypothetical protein BT93_J0032 [Corymbia citriodora subsp. variegata]